VKDANNQKTAKAPVLRSIYCGGWTRNAKDFAISRIWRLSRLTVFALSLSAEAFGVGGCASAVNPGLALIWIAFLSNPLAKAFGVDLGVPLFE
jgi:hypothetical protein